MIEYSMLVFREAIKVSEVDNICVYKFPRDYSHNLHPKIG